MTQDECGGGGGGVRWRYGGSPWYGYGEIPVMTELEVYPDGWPQRFRMFLPVKIGIMVWTDVFQRGRRYGTVHTIELNGSDEMGGGFFTVKLWNAEEGELTMMDFCFSDIGKTVFVDAEGD